MPHTRKPRTCEVCTTEYRPTYREQRTCSRACGVELRRREGTLSKPRPKPVVWPSSKVRYRTCAHCDRLFVKRATDKTRLCGDECRRSSKHEYDRRYNLVRPRKTSPPYYCRRCAQTEVLSWGHNCQPCRAAVRSRRRNEDKARRRAFKVGAAVVETVSLPTIAKRDGYRCGICHKRVNMRFAVPHPKAPTLDHVIPLSQGGDHSQANAQLAHFLCNSTKGDRVGDVQLVLFG